MQINICILFQSVIEKSELRRIPSLSSGNSGTGTVGSLGSGGGGGGGNSGGGGHQKKCGVSGESCSWNVSHSSEDESSDAASTTAILSGGGGGPAKSASTRTLEEPQRHHKDFRTRQLIRAALGDNDFLQNLDREQIRDMVDFMCPQTFSVGEFVIRVGEHYFSLEIKILSSLLD